MPEEEIKEEDKVKRRRFTSKDYGRIENFINEEFGKRKGMKMRKAHEEIWKVLDDQIAMVPPKTYVKSNDPDEQWHSAVQLGAIADALEILSADVMRLAFPVDKNWFTPHVEIQPEITDEGVLFDTQKQRTADGVLRSLMNQQHSDFGFKNRVKQAAKEALSHGGFAAEVSWDNMNKFFSGGRFLTLGSPVLDVHSMWNVFPDSSPSIYGTELFYRGSMILRRYMPRSKFMRQKMFIRKDLVRKMKSKPGEGTDDAIEDVELLIWYGDVSIPRSDGDMFLPNMKIVLANGTLVFIKSNETPYSPIIYSGYERDSLLDPYYTSPLVKRAPTHKLMTELMNRYVDGAELKSNPPVVYDSYDSSLVASGGPKIFPGSKEGIKGGGANFKVIDVGDPSFMFDSVLALRQDMREGLGVDSVRAGVSEGNEPTATEIIKREQKGELRSVDFLRVLDSQVLKPFLHMQHDLNLKKLSNYPFFNNELNTPDFLRVSKEELPKNVIFEVTGSKEVLGEEQRSNKFVIAVQGAAQIPQVSQRTDWDEVSTEVWRFTGIKDPERFVVKSETPEVTPEQIEQLRQQLQQLQQQLAETQQKSVKDDIEKATLNSEKDRLQQEIALLEEKEQGVSALRQREKSIEDQINKAKMDSAKAQGDRKFDIEMEKIELEKQKIRINAALELIKARRTGDDEREASAKDDVKSLNIQGLDRLIDAMEKSDNAEEVNRLIDEISKPRKVVRGKDGRIDGIE